MTRMMTADEESEPNNLQLISAIDTGRPIPMHEDPM